MSTNNGDKNNLNRYQSNYDPNISGSNDQIQNHFENSFSLDGMTFQNDPSVFSTKINIPGLGSVPGIVQQLPNGTIRLLSLSSNHQQGTGMIPHNDHSYFHTPSMYTNPNTFPPTSYYNMAPDMTFGGQFQLPEGIPYTQIPSSVPPLQIIDSRFQNNYIQNPAQNPSATLRNAPNSQPEMPNPNIVLREIVVPAHSNNFNSNKSINDIAFNNFFQHVCEVFQGSNFEVNESELLPTAITQFNALSKEQRERYLSPIRRSTVVETQDKEPTNASFPIPFNHNEGSLNKNQLNVSHPTCPQFYTEKKIRKKCHATGCQKIVEHNPDLGGFYCEEECCIVHTKAIFLKAFPALKKVKS